MGVLGALNTLVKSAGAVRFRLKSWLQSRRRKLALLSMTTSTCMSLDFPSISTTSRTHTPLLLLVASLSSLVLQSRPSETNSSNVPLLPSSHGSISNAPLLVPTRLRLHDDWGSVKATLEAGVVVLEGGERAREWDGRSRTVDRGRMTVKTEGGGGGGRLDTRVSVTRTLDNWGESTLGSGSVDSTGARQKDGGRGADGSGEKNEEGRGDDEGSGPLADSLEGGRGEHEEEDEDEAKMVEMMYGDICPNQFAGLPLSTRECLVIRTLARAPPLSSSPRHPISPLRAAAPFISQLPVPGIRGRGACFQKMQPSRCILPSTFAAAGIPKSLYIHFELLVFLYSTSSSHDFFFPWLPMDHVGEGDCQFPDLNLGTKHLLLSTWLSRRLSR
ncbi:hypothetical protein R3P38DRAFT_3297831 [Favolaschia claudopus]|uniref:Uncharacterized protein n=1 Tax=Favolaschia claudopus TaxID=2862362 RepID=A0AAV9Z5U5_9AGAR